MTLSYEQRIRGTRRRRLGLTLTELVVAVGVLVLLVLGFGVVLSQSQKVVVGAQEVIRANTTAAAIQDVIREDIRQASQFGVLHIEPDKLVVLRAGVSHSLTSPVTGMGSVVKYARTSSDVLYRQGWILSGDGTGGSPSGDVQNYDLADIQGMSPAEAQNFAQTIASAADPSLTEEPASLTDMNALWQFLAGDCTDLSFEWATGNGGSLMWSSGTQTWTRDDEWPTAVKMQFTVVGTSLPEEIASQPYEVICPLAQ